MRTRFQMMGLALGALFLSACALGAIDKSSGGAGGDETDGAGEAEAQGGAGGEAGQGGAGGQGGGEAGTGGTGGTGGAASSSSSNSGVGGGEAGTGGTGGTGGAASSSSSSSGVGGGEGGSGAGVPMNCGNGVIEEGEQCDGTEFGGKTCSSIGLGSGNLICNAFCGIVSAGCVPKENCTDFKDNDEDSLVDCLDDDCFMALTCTDSCAQPKSVSVGTGFYSNTEGRLSVLSNSCSSSSGAEAVFEFKASVDGPITVKADSWSGVDVSVALRTTCGDAASELLCSDKGNKPGIWEIEVLTFEATAGTTYFIVVDSAQGASGPFTISLEVPQPESLCNNFSDDDNDGLIDCDDPTDCKDTGKCMPGAGKTGVTCLKPSDCAANANDPVCLDQAHGFPGGYCSDWCDLAVPDCAGDGVCADIGLESKHGVCLDGCSTDSECRVGYSCVDKGLSSKVCALIPESDCTNAAEDDQDKLTDCEDPDCQSKAACVSGSKATGLPCTASNECYAGQNDPICIDDVNWGWPGGYCSEFCTVNDDCGPDAICAKRLFFPSATSTCLSVCLTNSECRPGYYCLAIVGAKEKVCVH